MQENGRNEQLNKPLMIAGKEFSSRLILGTGKYRNSEEMNGAFEASGTQMITVALRRIDFDDPKSRSVLEDVDWQKYQILPNTAGAATPEEAVRVARLSRSLGLSDWIKVEVQPDPKYLLPDPVGTYEASKMMIEEGFTVLPYMNADPVLAYRLQELGCATVMPAASPIGSGQGIPDYRLIQVIVEQAEVPVIVDAGIGAPSDAALAMELGADACLINTAIAQAENPALMARAMSKAVEAGREAFIAGRIPKKAYASASSPLEGVVR